MREDRPSATAGLIAWATAAQARLPELAPLVPAGAAEACGWFIEALRPGSLRALERSSLARLRLQLALFDRFSIRGICLHYLVRKRFLEQAVRAALGAQPAPTRRVLSSAPASTRCACACIGSFRRWSSSNATTPPPRR